MATFVTNTPLPRDSSTPVVRCAAHELNAEQRQQLARQALGGREPVTELAKRHQVSRQFVYHQAAQGAQALAQAFAPQAKDTEVLFYLPVTKAWRRQVVLGLILLCHIPFSGISCDFFMASDLICSGLFELWRRGNSDDQAGVHGGRSRGAEL